MWVLLTSAPSSLAVLASTGAVAMELAELQFTLGEGPCLDAFTAGVPVFATNLADRRARWPMFSPAATELGVRAEFSLPLQVGMAGLGTLDLHRDEPGMLNEDELSDALVAAELVTDAVLMMQSAAQGADLSWLLEPAGLDRLVVHQATGMIAVQADVSTGDGWPGCGRRLFGADGRCATSRSMSSTESSLFPTDWPSGAAYRPLRTDAKQMASGGRAWKIGSVSWSEHSRAWRTRWQTTSTSWSSCRG
jgi:hypothetical protein